MTYICYECGKVKIKEKRYKETGMCSRCEVKPLPHDVPQDLICWNKHCKAEFTGTMADHPKYTLCPRCKWARDQVNMHMFDEGRNETTSDNWAAVRRSTLIKM